MNNILKPGQGPVKRLVFCKIWVIITGIITQVKFQAEQANRDGNPLILIIFLCNF